MKECSYANGERQIGGHMQISFEPDEAAIVGYQEISGDFDAFDFNNKMVIAPGTPPRMVFNIAISGNGTIVKAK